MNATNTHDTKRSADLRARLDVLSAHAADWERRLAHWRRHHRDLRTLVGGRLAPTRTTDNFIYQSLIGLWPMGRRLARDGTAASHEVLLDELCQRLTAYIQKAVREAKVSTSWTDPDNEYEAAITRFIAGLLNGATHGPFLREVDQFVASIEDEGIWNALSRVVIHLTAPGVPDIYQGDELWMQALVDPDNRRPVDWSARAMVLDSVRNRPLAPLLSHAYDGRLKAAITNVILLYKRDNVALMSCKDIKALKTTGRYAEHVVAFNRSAEHQSLITVASRLTRVLGDGPPIGAVWHDTTLSVGEGTRWRCLLSDRTLDASQGVLALRDVLALLPVAVLELVR